MVAIVKWPRGAGPQLAPAGVHPERLSWGVRCSRQLWRILLFVCPIMVAGVGLAVVTLGLAQLSGTLGLSLACVFAVVVSALLWRQVVLWRLDGRLHGTYVVTNFVAAQGVALLTGLRFVVAAGRIADECGWTLGLRTRGVRLVRYFGHAS